MKRLPTLLLIPLLAGCTTGLDGNIPLEEAETMAPSELVATVHADAAVEPAQVVMDSRLWVPWGQPMDIHDRDLRSVGSTHGLTLHARAWDRAPLEAIFARTDRGTWQGYAPVIGHAGAAPAMAEH